MRVVHLLPLSPTIASLAIASLAIAVPLGAQTPAPPSASPAARPPAAPFVKTEAEAVVAALATQLEANFVFPEAGKDYAAMLRSKLAAGGYAQFADSEAFAKAVTADLQAVHKDGHLALHPPRTDAGGMRQMRRGPPDTNAITKSGWLADGIAYIDFAGFPGNEATLAALKSFIAAHQDAKTLIIDARNHHGGGLAEMDVMFPQLFAKPTVLVDMDTRVAVEQRGGDPLGDAMLRKVPGPEGVVRREHYVVPAAHQGALAKAKVYLLVSHDTGSAGEHLSLALKRTHRATLIGQTTRGMGNYGGMEPLGFGYAAFIPVGRTFDPDTGVGWEGTGVAPDVAVPADQALDKALQLAGVKVSGDVALASLK
jgi:peptidase S41-like protein